MYDVAVIGGGVIGGTAARELSKYKLKICILEKENDVATGSTKANSAIVHAGFDAENGSLKARFNVKGSEMMESLCRELGVKYKNNGSLVIGFNEDDKKQLKELYERGNKNGVKGLELLDREALVKLEKNISKNALYALYAPTGAIVCPYELAIASIGNAMDNGAELFLNFEVEKIEKDGDFWKIQSKNNSVTAKYVINACGIYSDKIAKMIGDNSFEITPRRGEYLLLDKECGDTVSHTIFRCPSKMGKGILVSPTVDNNLLLGPTSENIEDKTDKSTTEDGIAKIIKEACENVEGIKLNKVITSFCGLRAVGSTGDFVINMPKSNFINLGAIESPGLSSAPAIAEYVAEMLKNDGLELVKNENFNPVRKPMHAFKNADIETKNKMIKENPSYGKIVCRCETVTEGEILDAIRTNPKARDLDGVKRRTRAQMGRCQGGFCSPYIIELLAKEQNVDYTDVTKSGGKSVINIEKTKGEAE